MYALTYTHSHESHINERCVIYITHICLVDAHRGMRRIYCVFRTLNILKCKLCNVHVRYAYAICMHMGRVNATSLCKTSYVYHLLISLLLSPPSSFVSRDLSECVKRSWVLTVSDGECVCKIWCCRTCGPTRVNVKCFERSKLWLEVNVHFSNMSSICGQFIQLKKK